MISLLKVCKKKEEIYNRNLFLVTYILKYWNKWLINLKTKEKK